jgi:hypothetical protein
MIGMAPQMPFGTRAKRYKTPGMGNVLATRRA